MPKIERYHKSLDHSYALGIFPSIEALTHAPEHCRKLLLSEDIQGEGADILFALCDQHHIRVETADRALSRISEKKNTQAAVVFQKYESSLDPAKNHIVLYNIMDAGNLGTILRTALGFGFHDIAIIRPAVDVFEPQTIRASMGAIFRLRVKSYNSFEEYEKDHADRRCYPFMLEAKTSLLEAARLQADCGQPCSLIFGNEGSGLPQHFIHRGIPTKILHSEAIDSLNLGNAVSIALYKFTEGSFK